MQVTTSFTVVYQNIEFGPVQKHEDVYIFVFTLKASVVSPLVAVRSQSARRGFAGWLLVRQWCCR